MAQLIIRPNMKKIYVKETTADIKRQQRRSGDSFRLHQIPSNSLLTIQRHDILVMQDIESDVG